MHKLAEVVKSVLDDVAEVRPGRKWVHTITGWYLNIEAKVYNMVMDMLNTV